MITKKLTKFFFVKFNFMFGAIMQRLQVQILNYCHYEEEEVFNKKYSCFKDKTGETVWVEMFTEEKELRIFSKNAKSVQIVLNELNIIYPLERTIVWQRRKGNEEESYSYNDYAEEFFNSDNEIERDKIAKRKEEKKPTNAFICYSWTDADGKNDEEHRDKVQGLYQQLRTKRKIDAQID